MISELTKPPSLTGIALSVALKYFPTPFYLQCFVHWAMVSCHTPAFFPLPPFFPLPLIHPIACFPCIISHSLSDLQSCLSNCSQISISAHTKLHHLYMNAGTTQYQFLINCLRFLLLRMSKRSDISDYLHFSSQLLMF